jgi:hypothetical protein
MNDTPVVPMRWDDKPVIYVLIALGNKAGQSRAWGWYETKERAEEAVRSEYNNNIFEDGSYKYALIEETPVGIGSYSRAIWWYKVELGAGGYLITALDKSPPEWEYVVGFGLG